MYTIHLRISGSLIQFLGNVVQRAVHDHDPSPSACEEGHDREDDREVAGYDRVGELLEVKRMQDECPWTRVRVEHEQPDDHARRTRHGPGQIEDEAKHAADPVREGVHHQRQRHDKHGLSGQPDPLELENVFKRRREFEEVERVDEVRKTDATGRAER
jgi:hypothetical protein